MKDFSYVANATPAYIDELYQRFQQDPETVEAGWRDFFRGFDFAHSGNGDGQNGATATAPIDAVQISKELKVLAMIKAFRVRGHMEADINPLGLERDVEVNIDLHDFGLEDEDLQRSFQCASEVGMNAGSTLAEILSHLKTIYCGKIGFEYHHIASRDKRRWLRTRIEKHDPKQSYGISQAKKRRILEKLNGAVVFENFLHKKYLAQKRFSLEGGENAIVGLDTIINKAAEDRVEEIVIGMAHRGRLNVLANIMGKTYANIFNEFEGMAVPDLSFGDGDVKYHLGFSSQVETTSGKQVHLKLVPNPSHLEAVNPVVEGFARAKADILYESDYDRILPILIHGDAAVAGQGVVFETVQMSGLEGYYTGGTIHLVINNQIGFTTDLDDARTSFYSTGTAAVVAAPVFHVNGDDPEAVVYACEMAMEYRQQFNSDVFIDLVCYRKHGHNEGDDPQFTQPKMYDAIASHKDPREIYTDVLVHRGDVDSELAKEMENQFWQYLQERLDEVRESNLPYAYQQPEQAWRQLNKMPEPEEFQSSPETGIAKETIVRIFDHLANLPDDFTPLSKVKRLMKNVKKLRQNDQLDWAMGELAAYGSILLEGKDVRMSGQDVRRGTFSHRHAVLRDAEDYSEYNRLSDMAPDQGEFRIYNSLLSEFAVLGFEYGYSLATPDALVVWEAQFGDFSNGAQTIFDQFISAGLSKWRRMSGLVALLPHGYEGQGPEHSSARLERFLQLCAEFNMTVANVTQPANFFHLIRRQLARPFRRPLIVMSPKSLLRHPEVISPIDAFVSGTKFQEIIDDTDVGPRSAKKVRRIVLCSGKVYFDLLHYKREHKIKDIALVRLEQLYPLSSNQLNDILNKYSEAEDVVWVQEEPSNMGAWSYITNIFHYADMVDLKGRPLKYVARKSSSSPATGFKKVHDEEQAQIINDAMTF